MALTVSNILTKLGSASAGLWFAYTIFQQYFPYLLRSYLEPCIKKLAFIFNPYIQITFREFADEKMKRSEVFTFIQHYLSAKSTKGAKRLMADSIKDSQSVVLTLDDQEEVTDDFNGAKIWWSSGKNDPETDRDPADGKRLYKLMFHKRHRDMITGAYIAHVMKEGNAIQAGNRQRKLYANNPSTNWYPWKSNKWTHVVFKHPATFDTLAVPTKLKDEIKKDLIKFSEGKDYYDKIGKAWKRGYLLYGPPGTGKSTMIAAMANLLNYDVYDLELTTVKDNSELRMLLIETRSKSIIVIEDIDCSLDLTGQRKKKKDKEGDEDGDEDEKDQIAAEKKSSKVTLSGLLNFIDGIWSACGDERIIVFTTNFVDKLDPALIRRGRMDKHIEMSYCCFDAFKQLAKNYLDVEWHELFAEIEQLLEETKMTPADVAENLMKKSDEDDVETCLKRLIAALDDSKEEARKKAEEEERLKAEKEKKEATSAAAAAAAKEDAKENGVLKDEENGEASTGEVKENGHVVS